MLNESIFYILIILKLRFVKNLKIIIVDLTKKQIKIKSPSKCEFLFINFKFILSFLNIFLLIQSMITLMHQGYSSVSLIHGQIF